jgi:ferredoxin
MAKRKIIEINEKRCNGCGICIPNCPEGALQIIDKKARLVSDLFCDGLGACIGHCPQGAITIVERKAQPYDEKKVMKNIVKQGKNTIKAHLEHLQSHGEQGYLKEALSYLNKNKIQNPLLEKTVHHHDEGCPGARMMDLREKKKPSGKANVTSELQQWPVQFHLVPPSAPYLKNADILVAADCVPFAYGNFHQQLLRGRALLVGCPKLDDIEAYREKMIEIIKQNAPKSITIAMMEVPCCNGMYMMVEKAAKESGKKVPLHRVIIGINGEINE